MSSLPWLVGGGALAAYVWSRRPVAGAAAGGASATTTGATALASAPIEPRQLTAPAPSSSVDVTPLPGTWIWPVATWRGRVPVVSDGAGSPRPGGMHRGVDVMFPRAAGDTFEIGSPNGSMHHVMPDHVAVLAASDGVVWSARPTARGFAVVIDHGPRKLATFYAHLDTLFVTATTRAQAGQKVRAGQPIGTVGMSPLDGERLKHLHFELWRGGPGDWIDPAPLMRGWKTVADPRAATGVRNASLVYRPVGASGEPYPDWVRALKDQAGVYVIRERGGEILYVGSSAGRLYDTLTRHLQTWRRWKGFWKGQYGEGHDPGLTYDRASVEVAVRLTTPNASLDEEMRLIRRLKPRDNLIGQPEPTDDVPF